MENIKLEVSMPTVGEATPKPKDNISRCFQSKAASQEIFYKKEVIQLKSKVVEFRFYRILNLLCKVWTVFSFIVLDNKIGFYLYFCTKGVIVAIHNSN